MVNKKEKAVNGAEESTTPTSSVGGKDYYPSINELVDADPEGFKKLTGKLNKNWILCLLRDSISHPKKAKSKSELLTKIDNTILAPNQPLQTNTNPVVQGSMTVGKEKQCSKKSKHEMQLKFFGSNDSNEKFHIERGINDKNVVDGILEKLGTQEKSQDCFRVGKYDADKKRNILVTFKNIWEKRKCFSAAMRHQFYKRRKIPILPELSPTEKLLERKLLRKRYELISD